jgi:predicted nucleic-acid-binding protein
MLDNNVVIDRLIRRDPFYHSASQVFLMGIFQDAELYISTSMLTDVIYILQKHYKQAEAQEVMLECLEHLHLCSVSAEDGLWCLSQAWNDFEDCLATRCAENIKADYIVTRDLKGFEKSLVPAITPDALLALFEARGITYNEIAPIADSQAL